MSRYAPTKENLTALAEILRAGGLVAVPSETVYGLAADATNPEACRDIFTLKRRPFFDPLIVHVTGLEQARQYASWNPLAEHLAKAFWPGPLTLVLPRSPRIPDIVTSGGSTVALRAPRHPVLQALLAEVGRGLAAPSANPFGYISPTTAEHVESSFGNELPYILDGGPCPVGVESTIVDASSPDQLTILRHGGIPAEEIEALVGQMPSPPRVLRRPPPTSTDEGAQPVKAPGLLKRHYSPHTPLKLFPTGGMPEPSARPDVAHLFYQPRPDESDTENTFALSDEGDSRQAAGRLYALLRELDAQAWTAIFAERPPSNKEFSLALSDRLERAAARDDPAPG